MKRPKKPRPPAYLSPSPPIPKPEKGREELEERSPTRYGDWEKNGIAIDF
ncbi:DUF1674 domain-containing protein [Sphingomonas sp. HDW15A]|nr:DUF1674 domain-containing protein [Sphingomonas sp. HDW15A]QIK96941.1 DUF1674 domain-containing protein [Sphingomonas sp. HDW15A]